MYTHEITVIINGIEVYRETCENHRSMMQGHQLFKRFAIDRLKANEVFAAVYVEKEDGATEIKSMVYSGEDGAIYAQSRMNEPDFTPSSKWDEALDKKYKQ